MKHLKTLPVKGTDTAALFGTEKIGKILFKIAPPVMLAQLILALYNVVDSYFVGKFSDDGLTALSVIYPIQLFITALAVGTGVGVNTLMARRYAHDENDEADKTAGTGMVLAFVSWAVFALVSVFIMEPFVKLCTSSPNVIKDAVTYGRIVSVGSIGVYMEGCFTKVHQASGNMKLPTIAQVVGALTNIVLDPIFIFGFGFIPQMGVAGAAIATVIGQIAAAVITGALVLFLIAYVLIKGLPNVSWTLLSTAPSYLSDRIGILPDILNTLYIVIATLLIVLPLGVGAAIYLTEYATNRRLIGAIEYAAETLSGIPSIIYGLVGMLFFCQFLNMKTSLLAGALTLVIMNLPTIMRTTQESLKTVPQSYREGAFGLGAGKWRTIRTVVLPSCVDGIVTGCILSIGRILGESAALLFTAGSAHMLYNFFEGMHNAGATLTVALYFYAKESSDTGVVFAIAAILMLLTMLINLIADLVGRYFRRKQQ